MEQFRTASITHLANDDIVAVLDREQPNLLLMDFHLVSKETLGYMLAIRSSDRWHQLPVIMTSAIDYSQKCLNAGASDFIVKPFDWQEVVSRIKALLNNPTPPAA
ncbi:MAG: hypothetical protein Kow0031_21050 [Anaerolineae bacterium]